MDLIDRYLNAVAAQLPQAERDDIIAELRDLILSRFEAREETLARDLTDEEREAILQEIGHPLVVAARYRKGPDSLIGPELFPYWLFGIKAGLLVLGAVSVIGLFIDVTTGTANFGQDIAQAFHGFFGNALTLLGALTLAGAIMERYQIRPRWLTHWRVNDLSAFSLSDPAAWGASAAGTAKAKSTWMPRSRIRTWPGTEHLFGFIATGVFVLWWIGVVQFPSVGVVSFRGDDAVVTGAPLWAVLHGTILVFALAQMAVHLINLARPYARRMALVLDIVMACGGLWLTWLVWQAGHWFTLTMNGQSARIEGGQSLLNLDTLRILGRGDNADLMIWASNMSVVMTWVLAVIAFSLVFNILANLLRLARR